MAEDKAGPKQEHQQMGREQNEGQSITETEGLPDHEPVADTAYPSGVKLFLLMMALCLAVFVMALGKPLVFSFSSSFE